MTSAVVIPEAPRARRALFELLRPKRKLAFTRLGRWYCGLTIGIGFAALNTGNNLLFLILGLMLSSIIVSGILSEIALRGISVERILPTSSSVGAESLVGLCAANGKRRAPSFSLELREASAGDVHGRAYLLVLGAGESHEVAYRFAPARRGLHRLTAVVVATRWPFGLFEKSREIEEPAELIVFPRRIAPPADVRAAVGHAGERPSGRAGQGSELHALRDHRPGEDVRTVHWRSSARAGKLIAVEHEHERRRQVCVALDHRKLRGAALESAVERAAAFVERELDAGAEVALALCGTSIAARSGAAHLHTLLTALALVDTAADAPPPCPPPGAAAIFVGPVERL